MAYIWQDIDGGTCKLLTQLSSATTIFIDVTPVGTPYNMFECNRVLP